MRNKRSNSEGDLCASCQCPRWEHETTDPLLVSHSFACSSFAPAVEPEQPTCPRCNNTGHRFDLDGAGEYPPQVRCECITMTDPDEDWWERNVHGPDPATATHPDWCLMPKGHKGDCQRTIGRTLENRTTNLPLAARCERSLKPSWTCFSDMCQPCYDEHHNIVRLAVADEQARIEREVLDLPWGDGPGLTLVKQDVIDVIRGAQPTDIRIGEHKDDTGETP